MRHTFRLLLLFLAGVLIISGSANAESDTKIYTGFSLYGPGKYSDGFDHFDYVNPDAPKGGRMKMGAMGTFDSLNPFIPKGAPAAGTFSIYETLVSHSYDEPFSLYGLVAEKMEMPEDRSFIIFHLNPKARFHDGHPITADDVIFSFNTLVEKGDPLYQKYWADIKKVEALDERRVKFYLGDKVNPELAMIIGEIYILPKHYWEGRDFTKPTLEIPLGSGPYKVKEFQAGRSITYERVKDYWGKDLPVNKGRYNFDEITYDYYRDGTVILQAFKAGELDFRSENISKNWATLYNGPPFEDGFITKEEIPNDVNQGMQAFIMNLRRPLFQDSKVREALAYAFDFEWTNKNLFYGQYVRSNSFYSNSELAATGLPSKKELEILEPYRDKIPPEVFTKEYKAPATDGSGNNRKNLRTAIRLLKEAGWEIKNKKLVHKETGEPFKFSIMLVSPSFERVVLPFTQNLAKLGIEATYRTVDAAQYINRMREFDFDMMIASLGQSESPGNEQREYWGSHAADMPGSRNYAGIKNTVIDELIEKLIQSPTREELVAHCRALDRVLLWNHYVIPQWHTPYYRVAYWNHLVRPEKTPKYALDFYTWWIDMERAKEVMEYRGKSGQGGS